MTETIKVMVARIDERTKAIPKIEEHLRELNSSATEIQIKLAKTDEIAKSACEHAKSNRRYIDKLTIAVIVAVISALISGSAALVAVLG